jgi:hypothetical protein
MARIEPQKPDQTFSRSREFQREVLAYLKNMVHNLTRYSTFTSTPTVLQKYKPSYTS